MTRSSRLAAHELPARLIYVGGGRHEHTRTTGLSESLSVVLHAQGRAYCEAQESPPVCGDCRTIKERECTPT
jgi:hypothetical protein